MASEGGTVNDTKNTWYSLFGEMSRKVQVMQYRPSPNNLRGRGGKTWTTFNPAVLPMKYKACGVVLLPVSIVIRLVFHCPNLLSIGVGTRPGRVLKMMAS